MEAPFNTECHYNKLQQWRFLERFTWILLAAHGGKAGYEGANKSSYAIIYQTLWHLSCYFVGRFIIIFANALNKNPHLRGACIRLVICHVSQAPTWQVIVMITFIIRR